MWLISNERLRPSGSSRFGYKIELDIENYLNDFLPMPIKFYIIYMYTFQSQIVKQCLFLDVETKLVSAITLSIFIYCLKIYFSLASFFKQDIFRVMNGWFAKFN